MKHTLLLLALLSANIAWANKTNTANKVLQKTSDILNNLKSISYKSYREINNFKDNNFSKNSGSSYFEFNNSIEGKVARFRLQTSDALQVYNGTEYFYLNEKEKSMELDRKTPKQLNGISLLYNSIITIRLILPTIISDNEIAKSTKDTTIDGKIYDMVKFALNKKSIEYPIGFSSFDTEVIKFYKLIIDKKTALPFMIFDENSISKDQYYTKTIFTGIDLRPQEPQENSWYYSSYSGYEAKKKAIRKPMISTQSMLLNWELPIYGKKTNDTLKSSTVKGKIVMMEFWIKNCGYCMEAFPEIKELQEKYGNKIEILSINAYEKKEEIDFFYKREKPAYKMLYNGEKFSESLGIYAYPATIILDRNGKVIYAAGGFNKENIEKILKENI